MTLAVIFVSTVKQLSVRCISYKQSLSLSDCNKTWTHNHLIRKLTLNHLAKLAKWLSFVVSNYLHGGCGCGFKSCSSHLNFRFRACFEQEGPGHSGKYRVWIQSETRTWHYKNIQSNAPYWWVLITHWVFAEIHLLLLWAEP